MKILIDIKHPAQLNLFKGLSKDLVAEGWNVTISYLERGKLPKIIDREYSDFNRIAIGSSQGSKWSIFWHGNVMRTLNFFQLIFKHKYDICISASSIPLAYACYFTSTPVIQFYDDPERKGVNRINAFFSTKLFFPPIITASKKTGIFNCLKEWSYLSPKRFIPNNTILTEYGLTEHEYVFVREVSNKSFNYYSQQDAIVCSFASQLDPDIKVVLSVEDKSIANKYPAHWIILQEPVSDIHSLMFFSKLIVSSGDSMAREGAMLGVPSIYCGIREMKANKLLIDEGILFQYPVDSAVVPINELIAKPFDQYKQYAIREGLRDKWDDMNDFMTTQINIFKKS
jgi:predicted glycosyltransferase